MQTSWRKGWTIARVLWVMACLYVLARSLAYRNGDAQEFEFYVMLALSYPLSLAAMWGYAAMLNWIPSDGAVGMVLMWCFFFAVGCFQWFVVVPCLARKVKHALSKRGPISIVPRD